MRVSSWLQAKLAEEEHSSKQVTSNLAALQNRYDRLNRITVQRGLDTRSLRSKVDLQDSELKYFKETYPKQEAEVCSHGFPGCVCVHKFCLMQQLSDWGGATQSAIGTCSVLYLDRWQAQLHCFIGVTSHDTQGLMTFMSDAVLHIYKLCLPESWLSIACCHQHICIISTGLLGLGFAGRLLAHL